MLRDLVPYVRDAGIDCRWFAAGAAADFYTITKRIHYRMYGFPGDGGPLGVAERQCYENVHAALAGQVARLIQPGDLVLLHDPQPLGLAPVLAAAGARTVSTRIAFTDAMGLRWVRENRDEPRRFLADGSRGLETRRPSWARDVNSPRRGPGAG
jgi:hypothetical protein